MRIEKNFRLAAASGHSHAGSHTGASLLLCFYLPGDKLLVAADQLIVHDGVLTGANEAFTPDMLLAI
ncbi:hypothetical protein [Paenibacillus yonginensis]|uniref:hypothetical protein n=1 Tax=Paenibacillus yonginensis TaxID=1462996 RepID=UPI001471D33D|nr:hypothetical protein [Paenibacillus yonginensis]